MQAFRIVVLNIVLLAQGANAFLSTPCASKKHNNNHAAANTKNALNAHISEWRDMFFEDAPAKLVAASDGEPVREVCIFPFPPTDVLVQGETKELCLYEERFHKLFEKATTDHAGIVAMGFIAPPNGMLQCMPLCEVENYQTLEGDTGFGKSSILATIRVVGRAMLLDVQDPEEGIMEGYMKGWCTELSDDRTNFSSDSDLMTKYNEVADKCEDLFDSILGLDGDDDDDEEEDDDDDDYLDDFDEEDSGAKSVFRKAFQTAKASDTQGYTISLFDEDDNDDNDSTISSITATGQKKERSIQDLTALSWAYFAKDLWGEAADDDTIDGMLLKFRLSALNTVDLSGRLLLVSEMLVEQQKKLKKKIEKLQ
eukprot:jgi/Psemu1/231781/e_gw1.4242.2.1